MNPIQKIGLIAGNGQFPLLVAKELRKIGHEVIAVGFPGETSPDLVAEVVNMHWVKLGQLNKMIRVFKDARVTEVIMAGGITKTKLFSKLRPDWRAIRLLSKLDANSDDAILRAVAAELESEGIKVQSPTYYFESLLASPGIMTRRRPNKREKLDIQYGWSLAKEIGKLDIGQCIVVKKKAVLAVEGIDGTDATILRGGSLGKEGSVVIKISKPIQDLRFDVPAVGLETIRSMIKARASTLVLEAGKTIMFDRDKMIQLANKNKISILVLEDGPDKDIGVMKALETPVENELLKDASEIFPDDDSLSTTALCSKRKESVPRVRVGVIGIGYLGKYHAEKYANIPETELVGVVDIVAERAQKAAGHFSTSSFTDHRNLLGKVDAVSVVVPTPIHFSIARDFIEAGVHVLVEKPMTSTMDEGRKLTSLARNKGLILQVGHLERFNPAVQAMLPAVHSPMFIEAHRLALFKKRGTEVNVILDLMIHDLDIVLHIVKSPLKEIHAAGVPVLTNLPDIANVRLLFENGCTANITASRISTKDLRKIRIFQPDSYLSVDYAKPNVMVLSKVGSADESGFPEIQLEQLPINEQDALEAELKSFVDAIIQKKQPVVSAHDGLRALEVALAISKQIEDQFLSYKATS